MKPELIVSDWNGTLMTDRDDKAVLKQIGMDELKHALKTLRFGRVRELARTKKRLEEMTDKYRDDPESQARLLMETYKLYFLEVIDGLPLSRMLKSVRRYASKAVDRLDPAFDELLMANKDHITTMILTSALYDGVCEVTRRRGASLSVSGSGFGITKGRLTGLELRNYDNKHEVLENIVELRNYDNKREALENSVSHIKPPERVVYMGDDFRDEQCAGVADTFVVAPLATDDFRQHMASTYGGKVRTPGRKPKEVYNALTMD